MNSIQTATSDIDYAGEQPSEEELAEAQLYERCYFCDRERWEHDDTCTHEFNERPPTPEERKYAAQGEPLSEDVEF